MMMSLLNVNNSWKWEGCDEYTNNLCKYFLSRRTTTRLPVVDNGPCMNGPLMRIMKWFISANLRSLLFLFNINHSFVQTGNSKAPDFPIILLTFQITLPCTARLLPEKRAHPLPSQVTMGTYFRICRVIPCHHYNICRVGKGC